MTTTLETTDVEATTSVVLDELALLGDAPAARPAPVRFAGNPDYVEIAAVLVALAAVSGSEVPAPAPVEDGWGAPAQLLRYGLSAAPTAFVNARFTR